MSDKPWIDTNAMGAKNCPLAAKPQRDQWWDEPSKLSGKVRCIGTGRNFYTGDEIYAVLDEAAKKLEELEKNDR